MNEVVESVEFKFQVAGRYSRKKHAQYAVDIVKLHLDFSSIDESWIDYDSKNKEWSIGIDTDHFPVKDFVKKGIEILVSGGCKNIFVDGNPSYANGDSEVFFAMKDGDLRFYQTKDEMLQGLKPKSRIIETEFYNMAGDKGNILFRIRVKGKKKFEDIYAMYERLLIGVSVDPDKALLEFKAEIDRFHNATNSTGIDFPNSVDWKGNIDYGTSAFMKDICFLDKDGSFLYVGFTLGNSMKVLNSGLTNTMYLLWPSGGKIWCKVRPGSNSNKEVLILDVEDLWEVVGKQRPDDMWS